MNSLEKLHVITERLLNTDTYAYGALRATVHELYDYLVQISGVNPEDEKNRNNRLYMDNGYAIGLTWAAMCIQDLMRTKKFVDGLYEAVCDIKKKKGGKPVHLLYAGTGPFATLILPLTARFTSQELQLTLLEINQDSYTCLKKMLNDLNLEAYIHRLENVDATTWQVESNNTIDIFLTETMQKALKEEQQVAICMNIVPQLDTDAVMIPEQIILKAALIHNAKHSEDIHQNIPIINSFNDFFIFNKTNILQNAQAYNLSRENYSFPIVKTSVPKTVDNIIPRFNILTEIVIYGRQVLRDNESGLTIPLPLKQFHGNLPEKVQFCYQISKIPGIKIEVC
jgi:predicted RNA methylase